MTARSSGPTPSTVCQKVLVATAATRATARAERLDEAVQRLEGQREQPVGIDLHPTVGCRGRLVRPLAAEVERPAQAVEGERPDGG